MLEPADERRRNMLGSPVSSIDSTRATISEKKLLTSMRASAAPRQKCTP